MPIEEVRTRVTIEPVRPRHKVGNLVLEEARFFGRPNFSGEMDRFKDDRKKFTVLIPNHMADELRAIGWNVKTTVPEEGSEQEPLSHLKVMVDPGSEIWLLQGDAKEKLASTTIDIVDRSSFQQIDMEIRAWEYDPDESPGQLSARLVTFVGVRIPSTLSDKYGGLL